MTTQCPLHDGSLPEDSDTRDLATLEIELDRAYRQLSFELNEGTLGMQDIERFVVAAIKFETFDLFKRLNALEATKDGE